MSTPRVRRVVGFRVQAEFVGVKSLRGTRTVILAIVAVVTEVLNDSALTAGM